MSNMKNGFSTLNRWLGKKSKADKAMPNGKLSKSNTNLSSLSISSTNINETSQLEYNRITPLPAATSNAPFEQTFRITVLLPKDQLYVTRLGARVPLSKLLELVCENKLLDASKYEFRNPVDPSQVYSCDFTIGAVGLSEIRLCHKSESYDNFNSTEIIKLHRTPIIRDSLSSSEFSSRHSKHTTKTTSPYSSSNSLNSMDLANVNCIQMSVSPLPILTTIAAPPRKKRAAPLPPNQIAIPEKSVLVTNGEEATEEANTKFIEKSNDLLPSKNRYVSTPNLSMVTDVNCIDSNSHASSPTEKSHNGKSMNGYSPSDLEDEHSQVQQKNARNLCGGSVQNISNVSLQQLAVLPKPSPRKHLIQVRKKTAAPAPPPRGIMCGNSDTVYMQSMTLTTDMSLTPPPSNEELTDTIDEPKLALNTTKRPESPTRHQEDSKPTATPLQSSTPVLNAASSESTDENLESVPNAPRPLPRVTTATHLNDSSVNIEDFETELPTTNVSKIMLNRTPTPEPRSLSAEPPGSDSYLSAHITALKNASAIEHDDDALSKQADSGIGEPVPSPIPDSLPSEGSTHDGKSTFESSSDDDDIVKVYNFKLGKTLVKSPPEPQTLEDFAVLSSAQTDSDDNTPAPVISEMTPSFSDSASWNFSIPISPPPNFADGRLATSFESERPPDSPITPKITERPLLKFDLTNTETNGNKIHKNDHAVIGTAETTTPIMPLSNPITSLNEVVEELSTIINENRMDSLIKKADDAPKIETANPNILPNFNITTITQHTEENQPQMGQSKAATTPVANTSGISNSEALSKLPNVAQRSDLMKTEIIPTEMSTENVTRSPEPENNNDSRSSSQLSFIKIEENGIRLSRRRSSGELSIAESPSLQSLQVIKTILNSRKSSSANGSDSKSKTVSIDNAVMPMEQIAVERTNSVPIAETADKSRSEEKSGAAIVPTAVVTSSPETEPTSKATKPKELPKVYRYSGPPSINFSTWNERPKVQVAIKNEGDYIFGGKNADSQSAAVTAATIQISDNSVERHNRISMPMTSFWTRRENTPTPIAPKLMRAASPIERMGIPEICRIPVSFKPLRDVASENVELRSAAISGTQQKSATKVFNRKSTTVGGALLGDDPEREATKQSLAHVSTHTSTLPRSNANRFSILGPTLLRSTSITQLEVDKPKSTHTEIAAAPFGQNTLRKTGLKEKILAKEAGTQQKAIVDSDTSGAAQPSELQNTNAKYTNIICNGLVNITTSQPAAATATETATTTTTTTNVNHKPKKLVQTTKLELKLHNLNSVYLHHPIPSTPISQNSPTSPKFAPLTPPPPPPPKGVEVRKPNDNSNTTATSPDPRDQLLTAIRNFKREELNRV